MKNLATRVAGLATLALAALPVAALSTAAHAQNAPSGYVQETIRVGDLNLSAASGKATFAHRVDHVARHFCSAEKNLELRASCEAGVRTEANEKAASNTQFASRN